MAVRNCRDQWTQNQLKMKVIKLAEAGWRTLTKKKKKDGKRLFISCRGLLMADEDDDAYFSNKFLSFIASIDICTSTHIENSHKVMYEWYYKIMPLDKCPIFWS